MNFNQEVLKNNVIHLKPNEPFTWSSGIKSPIYCDNRLILGYPKLRKFVANELANIIKNKYPECQVVMGTSTAGIPHGTLVADILDLPCGYVRSGAKAHGLGKAVEGANVEGLKVVVIEDLISTGGSCIEVVKLLEQAGAEVLGIAAIFSYELALGIENFKENDIDFTTISTISELLDYSLESELLTIEDVQLVQKFIVNPKEWLN